MIDLQHQELSNYPVGSDDRATFSEIVRWISVVALLVCLILAYAWSRNEPQKRKQRIGGDQRHPSGGTFLFDQSGKRLSGGQ